MGREIWDGKGWALYYAFHSSSHKAKLYVQLLFLSSFIFKLK